MDEEPAPRPLSSVDQTVLLAARAWGTGGGIWDRFPTDRQAALRWGWDRDEARGNDPAGARDRLRREHAAQARPDLARVHASWWVRALKGEPPSVQRAAAAGLPAGVAEVLRDALNLAPEDLAPDRPAHPAAREAAVAIWSHRLVGDLPERDDDPPVVAALTRFDARAVARLVQATGVAKWSLSGHPLPDPGAEGPPLEHFREALAGADPRFAQVAARDVEGLGPGERHPVARAGLITVARLLHAAEPQRVRWALQHLPYPTAVALLGLMGPLNRRSPMLARWESDVLRAAWEWLHAEGRLPAGLEAPA